MTYIFLNEIEQFPEGISGYRLKKRMNNLLKNRIAGNHHEIPDMISQNFVYREFKSLKQAGLIDSKTTIVKNRTQILYSLNTKGQKHLEQLRKILENLAPVKSDPQQLTADLLAGKITLIDLLPKQLPKDQLLIQLRQIHTWIKAALSRIEAKIRELEQDLK